MKNSKNFSFLLREQFFFLWGFLFKIRVVHDSMEMRKIAERRRKGEKIAGECLRVVQGSLNRRSKVWSFFGTLKDASFEIPSRLIKFEELSLTFKWKITQFNDKISLLMTFFLLLFSLSHLQVSWIFLRGFDSHRSKSGFVSVDNRLSEKFSPSVYNHNFFRLIKLENMLERFHKNPNWILFNEEN